MSYHYTHKIAWAYGLTFSRACFCPLCYLMSSSLCTLPQYMCVLLHMVPDTRDSTADNHSSIPAVFQVGGLCVFFGRFSFRYLIMTDFFSNFYFSYFLNLSKIFNFFRLFLIVYFFIFSDFLNYSKTFYFFIFQCWN